MFPSHLPALSILQLLAITAIVIVGILWTSNPLFVLALFFGWSPPPLVDPNQSGHQEQTEAQGAPMGFHD
jgi:hypothetical protein